MANTSRPAGFSCFGAPVQVQIFESGSEIFPGDFLIMASDGQVDPAAATNDLIGLALNYCSASGQKVLVSVYPEQVYVGQADSTDIDAQTDVGQTYDILATAGNATYKTSRQQIGTASGGASQQLVFLGLVRAPDNAFGEFAKCFVKINQHQAFGTDDFAGI